MKSKKILLMFLIIISVSLVLNKNNVQAALQSNGDEPATKNRNDWMTTVRLMEEIGGGFGLSETQNADLTSSSGSNNIDIHMQKNTEYGAMALLSASAYGKPDKIQDGETTTGNKSGVVIPYNNEWTATDCTGGTTSYADRYINYYNIAEDEQKSGDAFIETLGWHETSSVYTKQYLTNSGLVRNYGNGIFGFTNRSFYYYLSWSNPTDDIAKISYTHTSRAVIINGVGI